MLSAKAWNGRIVCAWLADIMEQASTGFDPSYDDGRVVLAVHAVLPVSKYKLRHSVCVIVVKLVLDHCEIGH